MAAAFIILAAGKGTRMQSDLPKVLHPLGQAPLLHHAMRAASTLSPAQTVVVTGHQAEAVEDAARAYNPEVALVRQAEQLGTGHAVAQAVPALEGFAGDTIVLYGDTPFMTEATLRAMLAARATADIVVLGFEPDDTRRYGRLVTDGDALLRIVEHKDADEATRAIRLCNGGVICADTKRLFQLLDKVSNDNAAGEYYLTDIVELARAEGLTATVVRAPEAEVQGIDSRPQLAAAEALFQARARAAAQNAGARLLAPETVHFAFDTMLGDGAAVEPYVVFGPGVTVDPGAQIRAFSHLEGAHVARGAVVGPYARLRPGADLGEGAKVGNFVEVKNATLADGAKVNHLSYIGDATIGASTNVGAGTITCNYDGVFKHRTEIGAGAFIGSNTMLVAPVKIGAEAMTATGSIITRDVPDGAMAVARARQDNKPGFARRFFEKLRARKAKG